MTKLARKKVNKEFILVHKDPEVKDIKFTIYEDGSKEKAIARYRDNPSDNWKYHTGYKRLIEARKDWRSCVKKGWKRIV